MTEPNVRRLLRAARLCGELGHGNDIPAALDEMKRLRAENARLAREAHTWWAAAQTYAADAERLRAALVKIEAGMCIDPRTVAREALCPECGHGE